MKTKKSRVVLSSVSVLLVLSLLAGMTMAWFTDTEKVNANFTAGVLDISVKPGETDKGDLTFENLRPMLYDNFYKELEPNGNEKWVNDVTQDNTTGLDDEDYAPVPAYFKPVVIKNEGTLPAKVKLSLEAGDGCEAGEPILTEDNITIKQDPEKMQDCANRLAPVLKVFVYKLVGETWTKVEDVNLNTAYDEAKANPDKVASDNTAKETNNTYMTAMLPAQGTATYVIAGYLPETVNNAYQGQHFHSKLVLNAYQMDDTGAGKPDEGGSSSTDPEDPDRFEDNVTIEWHEGTAEGDLVKSQNETVKGDTTIAAVDYDAPNGYVYSPEAAEQSTEVTVNHETGEATPGKVIFTVVPEETKNVEITVKYEATFDTEDETDDREVKTATISLAAPGEYTLVTGNTAQGRVARNNGNEPKEITIPAPPAGFAYDPAGQTVSVQVDAEGNVTPEEIIFKVRSEEANVVIRYVDQASVGNDAIVDSYTDTVEATIGQKYTYSTDTPVVKDHLPEGYEFPTPGASVTIKYLDDFKDEDNTVDGKRVAYVSFVVKKTTGIETADVAVSLTDYFNEIPVKNNGLKLAETVTITKDNFKDLFGLENYELYPDTQSQTIVVSDNTANPNTISLTVRKVDAEGNTVLNRADGIDNIRLAMNMDFVLENNISMAKFGSAFEPIGWTDGSDVTFTGMLDGKGYEISQLEADWAPNNSTDNTNVGLFALNGGTIKNLNISTVGTGVLGGREVGIVAGQNTGTISNVHTNGYVGAIYVGSGSNDAGGITGVNKGIVEYCSSSVEAYGYSYVGGLVGKNYNKIDQSYAYVSINRTVSDYDILNSRKVYCYLGGIAGGNVGGNVGTVSDCYVIQKGDIRGEECVGGMLGTNGGTLKSCFLDQQSYFLTADTDVHEYVGKTQGTRLDLYYMNATEDDYGITSGKALAGFDSSIWSFSSGDYPDLIRNPR